MFYKLQAILLHGSYNNQNNNGAIYLKARIRTNMAFDDIRYIYKVYLCVCICWSFQIMFVKINLTQLIITEFFI